MLRYFTAGMALITCREALHMGISNNLKSTFMGNLRVSSNPSFGGIYDYV